MRLNVYCLLMLQLVLVTKYCGAKASVVYVACQGTSPCIMHYAKLFFIQELPAGTLSSADGRQDAMPTLKF